MAASWTSPRRSMSTRVPGDPSGLMLGPRRPRRPPTIGQHTRSVLGELLAIDDAQLATLKEKRII